MLPYREVWALDFEYRAPDGERPIPVCMVGLELRSGRMLRLWQDELPVRPPFHTDDDVLFLAYNLSAELKCFLELGWPIPQRMLDLYVEFRAKVSHRTAKEQGRSLLDALTYYGLPRITKEQKDAGRALVMRGPPWSAPERLEILDYCQTDVDPLAPLLARLWPFVTVDRKGHGRALLRARYMAAVAHMELQGIPIDTATHRRIHERRAAIEADLVREVDERYGVYEGTTFKLDRFEALIARAGLDWPRTPTGRLSLDHDDVFKPMSDAHPWLHELRELRNFQSRSKRESLTIGSDGRNRVSLWPFGTKTGRNAPSTTEFVFGPSKWVRHLIKPPEGRAVAYIDWSLQEFAVAAVLSGDQAMLAELGSGDMYLAFAKLAGLAPPDATKATHREVRNRCKPMVLGLNYGMRAETLSRRLGTTEGRAGDVLRTFERKFASYTAWAESQIEQGDLKRGMQTRLGWPLRVTDAARATTLRNFPMQGNAAEMMRVAACLATERGVEVCAPVHDAFLIEADIEAIEEAVEVMRGAMDEASKLLLDGYVVGTDVEVIRWPDCCTDGRGSELWSKLCALL